MRATLFGLLALVPACTDIGSGGAPAECVPSGHEGQSLSIAGVAPELDLQPGASKQLDVSLFGASANSSPGFTALGPGCAITWSVDGTGATVDADGTLTVDAASLPGTKRTVTAVVDEQSYAGNSEDPASLGGHIGNVSVDVWTFTPEAMPQLGTWHEAMRTGCADFTESAPPQSEKINELVVFASGLTWVTWQPFEVYIDYWATGSFHAPAASLSGAAGNYVPTDTDLDGNFSIDNGDLLLTNMFLGTRHPSAAASNICGHRFTKL